jgi:hypothetical protein
MSREAMLEARDLIKHKRYDEARFVLKTVDHPLAKEWLGKLDQIAPPPPQDEPDPFDDPFADVEGLSGVAAPAWVNPLMQDASPPRPLAAPPARKPGTVPMPIAIIGLLGLVLLSAFVLLLIWALTRGGDDLKYGDTIEGRVTDTGGERHTFSGKAGDNVDISVDSNFDSVLELKDSAGRQLAVNDDSEGFGADARLVYHLPSGGDYTIVVRGFAGDEGRYKLSLKRADGQVQTGGGSIAYGESVNRILNGGSGDRWTFSASAGDVITIFMQGNFDTYLELYNPAGVKIAENDDNGVWEQSLITGALLDSGQYTILARAYGFGGGGGYTLSLYKQ